ncbi:MAG TPA: fumarylacetoacetate hydrolase family protein [Anaerolineae bacterium]|nr:fumarylacetoacetate hydrolase family protein [Anaerolineae bacterium]
MQLVTFAHQRQSRLGVRLVHEGRRYVIDLHAAQPDLPGEMIAFLNAGEQALRLARQTAAAAPDRALRPEGDVRLLAPVLRPGKIICLGHNYFDHMGQGNEIPPEHPTFFCKTVNTIIGTGQAIVLPKISQQVDYEAELAVVMGRSARQVSPAQALEYVAGYTIFNDVSARDIQKRSSQWMLGKSFDTFGPLGPALVTTDEIPDPHTLELSLTHNDLERQHTNTRHMIFSIPMLIACLSEVMTLEPGDVISTGTPARINGEPGVPIFMKPGDTVTIRIEKIGELINPVAT